MNTKEKSMLFRFSLYGFLKNQKYYDPFLILALLDKGLSFFMIGLLIGFRQLWVNILEIPSGLAADVYGRRRAMIISFVAYIISFVIFAVSRPLWSLFLAMLFFALGEVFRTGTHKAMIFDWLLENDMAAEKTRYYGLTRSWSQVGAALSVIIGATAVLITADYSIIFWISIVPYLLNIINFMGYPAYLDGDTTARPPLSELFSTLFKVFADSFRNRPLRRLFIESMTHKGSYTVSKEYLQPLVQQAALALPFLLYWTEERRSAILMGIVFSVLYLLSGLASRDSHRFSERRGGDEKASRTLWVLNLVLFAGLIPALWFHWNWIAISLFVIIAVLQNTWRPILLSRIDSHSDSRMGATILSIDSQAGSFFVMIVAPLLGLAVDKMGLLPVAVFGTMAAAFILIFVRKPASE